MAKSKRPKATAQGVTDARKRLAEATAKASISSTKSARRAVIRAKDAELRAQLSALRSLGLYDVKISTPAETIQGVGIKLRALVTGDGTERTPALTRGRKQRIRAAYKELEALQRSAIYAPYPSIKPEEKAKVAALVKSGGGRVTRKGVFIKRDEGEMRAGETQLVRERDTGLYKIVQINRYTDKRGRRKTVRAEAYLDGIEALERQEAALRKRFDRAKAGLGKNERIRFAIGGPNGNISRASFSSWETFRARVMAYRRDPRAQATFMASLTVYVASTESPRSRTYRQPVAWVDNAGRLHRPGSDNLYGGELFPVPDSNKKRKSPRRRNRG